MQHQIIIKAIKISKIVEQEYLNRQHNQTQRVRLIRQLPSRVVAAQLDTPRPHSGNKKTLD